MPSRGPAATSSAARQSANAGQEAARLRVPKRFEPTALTSASPAGTETASTITSTSAAVRAPRGARAAPRRASPASPRRERERERDERRHAGQLAHARCPSQEVGEPDRPVDEARLHVAERRTADSADRMSVVGESRSPLSPESHGRKPTAATAVADDRRPARRRVRPQDPRELPAEREDARVVRVDRGARAGGVGRPPARLRPSLDRGEQAEGGAQHQRHHQPVAPGLGGVVDHERREASSARRPRAPPGARPCAGRAGTRAGSSARRRSATARAAAPARGRSASSATTRRSTAAA